MAKKNKTSHSGDSFWWIMFFFIVAFLLFINIPMSGMAPVVGGVILVQAFIGWLVYISN